MNDMLSLWWRTIKETAHQALMAYPLLDRPAELAVLTTAVIATLVLASCTMVLGGAPVSAATATGEVVAQAPAYESQVPVVAPGEARQPTNGRVICIDPGHGGPESGAARGDLLEKDVNLRIALKLAERLKADGYEVVLTRDSDSAPSARSDRAWAGLAADLQARVDIANAADADLFISIHNNAAANASASGTEVWYSGSRSFGDENKRLAQLVQTGILTRLEEFGHESADLGIKDDINFGAWSGRTGNIYVLGPGTGSASHAPTRMPGILGESLFLSNARDARVLSQDEGLDAIAQGYHDGIVAYFDQSGR